MRESQELQNKFSSSLNILKELKAISKAPENDKEKPLIKENPQEKVPSTMKEISVLKEELLNLSTMMKVNIKT